MSMTRKPLQKRPSVGPVPKYLSPNIPSNAWWISAQKLSRLLDSAAAFMVLYVRLTSGVWFDTIMLKF